MAGDGPADWRTDKAQSRVQSGMPMNRKMVAPAVPGLQPNPRRSFGRFELRRPLGKSAGTMVWLAHDPDPGQELMLTLPRVQPADAPALETWQREARMAARLNHPQLSPVVECGVQDHWPFIAVDRAPGVTLKEWISAHPKPMPPEVAGWLCDTLRGLAFAHEAGVAHLAATAQHRRQRTWQCLPDGPRRRG